jgi:hypothetical protein
LRGGIAALRDLVAVRGHDAHRLLTLVEHILADSEWAVATARGVPQREQQLAGATAAQRLDLARDKLMTPEPATASVVWLEYLQATVRWPPMLRLGEHVTLFNADYLRQAIHEQRSGDEIPKELEDPLATGLPIWMGAFDKEEAATAQHGDPRVFIRIQLGELPAPRLLEAARETAEFLPAYAALRTAIKTFGFTATATSSSVSNPARTPSASTKRGRGRRFTPTQQQLS